MARRGLTDETLERFQIGYAPNAWNELLKRFGGSDPARKALLDCGLVIERERGQTQFGERYYDRFRDRVMFPIRDARGRVIAFGGRIIDQGEPKYLNSPETVLFHKGRELYGALRDAPRPYQPYAPADRRRLHGRGAPASVGHRLRGGDAGHGHDARAPEAAVPPGERSWCSAFDGDRAGRAAAWRALQQALPEAREGRELRFLFLPEGHDPDSLVGEEGREAFEARLSGALPLSEYLVRELTREGDLTHADGRATFAEQARPLFLKVPDGVYRELLLERLAEVVGLSATRLRALWVPGAAAEEAGATPVPLRRASTRTAIGAGRGSLVRQAIVRLLHHPQIAAEVSEAERAGLEGSEEPGVPLLRALLDDLRAHPAQIPAQVVQRWAEREGGEALPKLLEREEVFTDAPAAAGELRGALLKLAEQAAGRRLEALEAKSRSATLSAHEFDEFQQLIVKLRTRDARGG